MFTEEQLEVMRATGTNISGDLDSLLLVGEVLLCMRHEMHCTGKDDNEEFTAYALGLESALMLLGRVIMTGIEGIAETN